MAIKEYTILVLRPDFIAHVVKVHSAMWKRQMKFQRSPSERRVGEASWVPWENGCYRGGLGGRKKWAASEASEVNDEAPSSARAKQASEASEVSERRRMRRARRLAFILSLEDVETHVCLTTTGNL
jgi:hypothetical protein